MDNEKEIEILENAPSICYIGEKEIEIKELSIFENRKICLLAEKILNKHISLIASTPEKDMPFFDVFMFDEDIFELYEIAIEKKINKEEIKNTLKYGQDYELIRTIWERNKISESLKKGMELRWKNQIKFI